MDVEIASIVTGVAALTVSIVSLAMSYHNRQQEVARREREERQGQRLQAGRVASWVWERPGPEPQLWIMNTSGDPIWDVEVRSPDDVLITSTEMQPPTSGYEQATPRDGVDVPLAGLLSIEFTDAFGQRWRRSHDGQLIEISRP